MRRLFEIGGYVAAVALVAFGIAALVLGLQARENIQDNLALEQIEGSPDMTPAAIRQEVQEAGLQLENLPTEAVAGETIDTGGEARIFAQYMRVHALLATGGRVYAEMARYLTPTGEETNDAAAAAQDEEGRPVSNSARDIWVTWTALSTALNVSYFGEQVSLFSILVAVALIIAGIGFGVLAFSAFRWLPAREVRRAGPEDTGVRTDETAGPL
jgi:hypothetical protein